MERPAVTIIGRTGYCCERFYVNARAPVAAVLAAILVGLPGLRGPSLALAADDPPTPSGEEARPATAAAGETLDFERDVRPFFRRYCTSCHGRRKQTAKLNLSIYTSPDSVLKDRKTWEKVLDMLVQREMPPSDKRQPDEAERQAISAWIHHQLESYDCSGEVDPGRVTIRRLNRAEYNNTVRDLLGVDVRPGDQFPADDVGYGFDNIGDVLSMPPLLFEKYLDAAESVLDVALERERQRPDRSVRLEAEAWDAENDAAAQPFAGGFLGLYRTGEAFTEYEFPHAGEFVFRVRAFAQQAGPEVARMAIRLGGKDVRVVDVAAEEDSPRVYTARTRVERGKNRIGVAYVNNYVNDRHPDPALRGDRNFFFDWVDVVPAKQTVDGPPPVLIARPDSKHDVARASREILAAFGRRAYRRPLRDAELNRLVELVTNAVEERAPFEEAIRVGLGAVLVSPHFLFRVELHPNPSDAAEIGPVSDWELASRLSYFLWSSMPDAELFGLAEDGRLSEDAILRAQIDRMLADPKARAFVENFAGQWLKTRQLAGVEPDREAFPSFDEELRDAMRTETETFFAYVLRENRSILDFIDADYTFVNERLARHYRMEDVEGPQFRRVDAGDRGGLLTQASILTLTSNPTRTSPVKRGLWILEEILAAPPPPPPPGVSDLSEEQEAILSGSLRERLEKHREDPSCAQCHRKMDPLGFAFENYDGIGAWREFDGTFLIDASGELPSGRKFDGPEGLKKILLEDANRFAEALAEKLLTYAIGRGLEYYDKCAVDAIVEAAARDDYKLTTMIHGVVRSAPFRMRRGEGAER